MSSTAGQGGAEAISDRIEKETFIRAPRSRVWQALTDSAQFGAWFRVALDGPFVPGGRLTGQITYPGYEHLRFAVEDIVIAPEDYFAFRWHPYPKDPQQDYSSEPTTLVEFRLSDTEDGTLLQVVESGFDLIPLGRREEAFRANSGGWTGQMNNIKAYVEG